VTGERVFILGAGFSRAIGEKMPLMRDLVPEVLNAVGRDKPLPTEVWSFRDDLEALLSYLADNQPWLSEEANLRNKAWFGDVSHAIAEVIGAAQRYTVQQPEPLWLRPLIDHWIRTGATVITFNYDVLIETATDGRFGPEGNWSSTYRAPVVPAGQRLGAVWGIAELSTMSLLKLHGSLTWYWSGINSDPHDQIYDIGLNRGWGHHGLESPYQQYLPKLMSDKQPMVVPPAATKSRFYDNAVLSSQWKGAAQALRDAQELVLIGYSLPKSDLVTRSLLLTNFKGTKAVPVDHSEAVVDNLNDLWSSTLPIDATYAGQEDAVARYVQATCN
jgi:hypothetical protein